MNRTVIHTAQAPAPVGPYSQAIAVGSLLFVSGQIPLDPQTGAIISPEISQQTEQAIANLEAVLKAAGASIADVAKTTVYLADLNEFAAMNAVYARWFDEATAPARACVEVARLPKDVRVEIDCIAVLPR